MSQTQPTNSAEAGERYIWDDHYNDPNAEIVLKSNDGVAFRVHSWMLARTSTFFADLVKVAGTNNTPQNPITMDHSAAVIRMFLYLVYTPPENNIRCNCTDWETCKQTIDMCDRLQAPDIDRRFLYALCRAEDHLVHYWEIFGLANMRNDIQLAKTIIPRFQVGVILSSDLFENMREHCPEGITIAWFSQLAEHRVFWSKEESNKMEYRINSWDKVAELFDPQHL